jgi:hypothetical protein
MLRIVSMKLGCGFGGSAAFLMLAAQSRTAQSRFQALAPTYSLS